MPPDIGVNPGGLGVRELPDFGQGVVGESRGVAGGSWGRERVVKYYYLIMYRKYARKC